MKDQSFCSQIWLDPIQGPQQGTPKIGLEMEIFAYDADTLAPLGTAGTMCPQQVMRNVASLVPGSELAVDEPTGVVIGVGLPNGSNFSLEPGGQIEFSSLPCQKLSQLVAETKAGLQLLERAAGPSVVYLSHGTNPVAAADHPLVVPKERYQIMTRYFEGGPPDLRAIDMMRHCATVQVNLDVFGSDQWADAVRLVTMLIPLTRYLFANSHYTKGHASVHPSERQDVWDHMEPGRSGFPFVTDSTYAEEALSWWAECPECVYAAWARQAPVFLVEALPPELQPRYGELTFTRWMLEGYRGVFPGPAEWQTHLGTLFPHLRLRKFLEIRHIDAQPFQHTLAPIAFFAALIQSEHTRQRVWDLLETFALDKHTLFAVPGQVYAFTHKPLLHLAHELLCAQGEAEAAQCILDYEVFYDTRAVLWQRLSAQEFLNAYKTPCPSRFFTSK